MLYEVCDTHSYITWPYQIADHNCRITWVVSKVKSCYNPLRLRTVIVLVSSGIDFVNTPRLYRDRTTR